MSAQEDLPILIAGAGIAGLSCALAMAKRGFKILVFEKSDQISEVGAGLQLAPNATLLLDRLNVLEHLRSSSVEPDAILLKDGRTNATLTKMSLGNSDPDKKKPPYLVCHRADLQRSLLLACAQSPNIKIGLGADLLSYKNHASHIEATIKLGSETRHFKGLLLIGCDGVWSDIAPNRPKAEFSGFNAWRVTLKTNELSPALANNTNVSAWLSRETHLVSYPICAGEKHNFVAITHSPNRGHSWNEKGSKTALLHEFAKWNPLIKSVLDASSDWTYWPLYEMPKPYFIADERTILLGDAAHAMTPFAAQGAAMAIEDACALAEAFSIHGISDLMEINRAFQAFSKVRSSRIEKVAKRGKLNRFAYHASGPAAFVRNSLLKIRAPESFFKDLDWLYSYDAEAAMRNGD